MLAWGIRTYNLVLQSCSPASLQQVLQSNHWTTSGLPTGRLKQHYHTVMTMDCVENYYLYGPFDIHKLNGVGYHRTQNHLILNIVTIGIPQKKNEVVGNSQQEECRPC